ncbi:MAG: peroxiredoxin [Myxococcales bacterium]|nr:MAG: peroxiredoxin [Myxococcales bacterium]
MLPAITVHNQNGKSIELAKIGVPTVVYFYPKDDTPGCTVEAKGFRDSWKTLSAMGVYLLGVSADDAASHQAFAEKYQLPFDLVADTDKELAKAFGVPSTLGFFKRMTFVADEKGRIIKVYREVEPANHARELSRCLKRAGLSAVCMASR